MSILLGSKSKNLLDPLFPLAKLPVAFVVLENGTPSTMNKGCVFPDMEFNERIVILVADPEIPLVLFIVTPEALPVRIRPISPSVLCSISAALIWLLA